MRLQEIIGLEVITGDGHELGIVRDLVLGENWTIESIIVRVHRDAGTTLHLKKTLFRSAELTIPTNDVSGVHAKLVLHKTLAALGQETPETGETHESSADPRERA